MAKAKPAKKHTSAVLSSTAPVPYTPTDTVQKAKSRKALIVGLVFLGLALWLGSRGWIVAAVVNGRPIFRWQMTQTLVSRFGKQTLEGMISEALIADAAAKVGVRVSQDEIDAQTADIVAGLGEGVTLEQMLEFQGMTRQDFEAQIKLQLTIEKLLGKDIQIAESDVDNYIATNRATLAATNEADLREEAREAIFTQKVGEKVQSWFVGLRDSAKILRFL